MVLQAPKLSLPVIVLNESDPEMEEVADAHIFWEHAFAEKVHWVVANQEKDCEDNEILRSSSGQCAAKFYMR